MTYAKRLTYVYLILWVLEYPACSSNESLKELAKSSAKNDSAVAGNNTTEADFEDDFPPLNFFFKDVKTILLEKVNHSASSSPNISKILDLDEVISELDETLNETKPENISGLNYETLWQNGSLTLTLVELEERHQNTTGAPNENGFSIIDKPENAPRNSNVIREDLNLFLQPHSLRRLKRAVFGPDDRVKVLSVKALPYSAVVRISTGSSGCTGTLISTQHVLTAAHCVHDGMNYRVDINKYLKVGIPKHQGKLRWIRAQYVKIPRGWTLNGDYRYDYAVIKLRRPHGMSPLGMYDLDPQLSVPIRRIQFASFPADKPENTMWYSYCKAHLVDHVILNRCDSNYGSSGAGIYSKKTSGQSARTYVIGVFSGLGDRVRFRGKLRRMNVGIKITPVKLAQIRSWMRHSSTGKSSRRMAGHNKYSKPTDAGYSNMHDLSKGNN